LSLLAAVSRQTVNRSLSTLQTAGLIRVERGAIDIFDVDKLAMFGN
jgi:DNA-binding transcriptional regulator YhcF (GntR family)